MTIYIVSRRTSWRSGRPTVFVMSAVYMYNAGGSVSMSFCIVIIITGFHGDCDWNFCCWIVITIRTTYTVNGHYRNVIDVWTQLLRLLHKHISYVVCEFFCVRCMLVALIQPRLLICACKEYTTIHIAMTIILCAFVTVILMINGVYVDFD